MNTPKLLRSKAGIPDDAHGSGVQGIVPGDGEDAPAVGHHDVRTSPNNLEACPLERPHGPKVRDSGDFRHELHGNFYFSQILPSRQLSGHSKLLLDRIPDVGQCFFLGGSLRPAPGQTGAGYAKSLYG
jgi:hypothetical protein